MPLTSASLQRRRSCRQKPMALLPAPPQLLQSRPVRGVRAWAQRGCPKPAETGGSHCCNENPPELRHVVLSQRKGKPDPANSML